MKRKRLYVSITAVALAIVLGTSAMGQGTTVEGFTLSIEELSGLIDRALYLATAGLSAYGEDDKLILAQGLVNLFEGPEGEHYSNALATVVETGILDSPLIAFTPNWVSWFQSLSGSQALIAVDALSNVRVYLELAYEMSLAILETNSGWFGDEYSWRIAYAALLAARGSVDDPLLLPGVSRLASLELMEDTIAMSAVEPVLSLQREIQETPEGGVLFLTSGVYGAQAVVTQDIIIRGISPAETILEGTPWTPVIQIAADGPVTVQLEDLTIRGGMSGLSTLLGGGSDAQIKVTLKNVHFLSNEIGILVSHPVQLSAQECLFQGNGTAVRALSTDASVTSELTLTGCEFSENGTAFMVQGNHTLALRDCLILNGTDPGADITIYDLATLQMSDCEIRRVAGGGIRLAGSAFAVLTNNVIVTPYTLGLAVNPLTEEDQRCGSGFSSNRTGLPRGEITGHGNLIEYGICPVTMRFLTDPAPSELTVVPGESIQAAIDIVADGGAIYIEPGEYRETLLIAKSVQLITDPRAGIYQPIGVYLLGEPGDTMISITSLEAIEVAIRGIALRGGARGIDVKENVSVSLDEMAFTELGTALTITYGASVQADNCTFSDNTSAVRAYFGASCTLRDSLIERCTTDESSLAVQNAISAYCSDLVLENCTIRDNQGSGVKLGGGETSRLHMVNCFITGNAYGLELEYGSCNPGSDPNWEPPTHPGFKSHGTISGWGNTIPGPDEPKGNSEAAIDYYYKSFIDPWFLTEPAPAELLVEPGQSIQAAIDSATDGDTIVIGEGTYRENLAIEKPLTLLGVGEVTIIPVDQENPAIQIAETEGVVIQGIQIESAVTGIDMVQASCRIVDCLFRDTDVGVRAVTMDFDVVRIQQCTFIGETAGVGIQVNGSGTIEIENCDFDGLGTGAILSGMTSVLVDDCTFRDCYDGIVLASSVEGTLTGNEIDGSGGSGIRVAAVPVPPVLVPSGVLDDLLTDVTLTLVDNVIQNSWRWGLSFCDTADPEVVAFKGTLLGSGNQIDNMNPLCLVDYEWPEGFFANE